ncbi:MAG: apolipoprotein N-acyltransferase [Candidatus Brocadiia bacterium]
MTETEAAPPEPETLRSPPWWLRPVLAVLSGVLIYLSFPPADIAPLAFVAFVPLLLAIHDAPCRAALLYGVLAATAAYVPAFAWVSSVAVAGWLGLAVYVGLYLVAAAVAWRILQAGFPALWPLFGALLWAGLELFRARLGPGFPWLFMGYTQYRFGALVQAAAWGGVYGVSFLVLFVNTAAAAVLRRRLRWFAASGSPAWPILAAAVGLVALCASMGAVTRNRLEIRNGPVVGTVQQNIPRIVDEIFRPKTSEEFYDGMEAEVAKAAELTRRLAPRRPRLVVWPETTVGVPLNLAPELFSVGRERDILEDTLDLLRSFGEELDTYMLVGSPTYFARSAGYVERLAYGTEVRNFGNSALLFSPEGEFVERYDKIRLVPFGEYIPWREMLPFLQAFTPIGRELTPGDKEVIFRLPTREGQTVRFAALICYEDVFPDLTASFRRRGADFLVNLTDEGWYTVPGELGQHLAMAVFRAVETRTTVVRSANTGVSCFIGPTGEIYAGLPRQQEGSLAAPVRLCDAVTPYVRSGDAVGVSCLMLSIILPGVLLALRRRDNLPTAIRERDSD